MPVEVWLPMVGLMIAFVVVVTIIAFGTGHATDLSRRT